MSDEGGELPYDQPLEIESSKSFAAYCCYRDQGITRSIDRAYAAFCQQHRNGTKTAPTNTAAPRHWKEWARLNEWARRAKGWDAYLEEQNRKDAEAEHLRALRLFRDKCLEEARRKNRTANRLLDRLEMRLDAPDADPSEGTLAALARAAAALGSVARDDEAIALGVDEIARRLED